MISIRVPATSANLGPGFDCLGLAVNLFLEVKLTLSERDGLSYHGQGQLADTADNLIHQGFRAAFAACDKSAPTAHFEAHNPIPLARGLGSSSAALVAGVALADVLLGHRLGREGIFQLAAQIEGHPDNVAPAIFGGFTVAALTAQGNYLYQALPIPKNWQFIFAVPDFELLTSQARTVLPETYSRADVIFTSSRSALWTAAVALNKPELLTVAAQDVLHEPYREALITGFSACRQSLSNAGATAVYLSGAGPTVAAISLDDSTTKRCKAVMRDFIGTGGRIYELSTSEGFSYLDASAKVASKPIL